MFLGISPVRISFAGGGTDMPEFYENYGGNVVTTAITRFTYVIINPRSDNSFQLFSPDFQAHNKPTSFDNLSPQEGTELAISALKYLNFKQGINLMISSDVPPRSGLGASSSLMVNLVNTIFSLQDKNMDKNIVAETAFDIARNFLKWPIGKQDEYIASYGGFNFIKFEKEKINVNPIQLSKNSLDELQKNILLFFIGGRTNSNILLTQIDKIKNKNKDTIDSLNKVKQLGEDMYRSLLNSDITNFGELLHKGWMAKRNLVKGITNDHIDKIYDLALKSGVLGGKLTGAGAGGHLLLYCELPKQQLVKNEMNKLGLKQVKFSFHNEGAKILNLYDYSDIK